MLTRLKGNIFNSKAPVLVNPVNCEGVAGAGLALEFKLRVPSNHEKYASVAKKGILKPGGILPVKFEGRTILNAATKEVWKKPSNPVWVSEIIGKIARHKQYTHIAMPYLGAGKGGLSEQLVYYLMDEVFHDHPTHIELWEFDQNAACPLYTNLLDLYRRSKNEGKVDKFIEYLGLEDYAQQVKHFCEHPTGSIYHLMDDIGSLKVNLYKIRGI